MTPMKHKHSIPALLLALTLLFSLVCVPLPGSAYQYNGSKTVTDITARYYTDNTFSAYLASNQSMWYDAALDDWREAVELTVYYNDGSTAVITGVSAINSSSINGKSFYCTYNGLDQQMLIFGQNYLYIQYGEWYIEIPFYINWKFTDVSSSQWFFKSVRFVSNNRVMTGVSNTSFAPQAKLTREMFVTILYRLTDENYSGAAQTPFTDVKANTWSTPAINWAYDLGLVDGTSPTTFSPGANITREAACKIIANFCAAYDKPLSSSNISFADQAKISGWALPMVKACYHNGIVSGKDNNRFDPQGLTTRAEAATLIMNLCQKVYGDIDWFE